MINIYGLESKQELAEAEHAARATLDSVEKHQQSIAARQHQQAVQNAEAIRKLRESNQEKQLQRQLENSKIYTQALIKELESLESEPFMFEIDQEAYTNIKDQFATALIDANGDAEKAIKSVYDDIEQQRLAAEQRIAEARKSGDLAALAAEEELYKKRIENLEAKDRQAQKIGAASAKAKAKTDEEQTKKREKLAADELSKYTANRKKAIIGLSERERQEAEKNLAAKLKEEEGLTDDEAAAQAHKAIAAQEKAAQKEAIKSAVTDMVKELKSQADSIASNQTAVDTRLQGLRAPTLLGSYWRVYDAKISSGVGISPFVQQEKVVENLRSLISQGVAFDVEQRAFLMTISDKIATTFEAADGTLLRLVRIQQADTTAARLGMESALTSFLNSMYATSEYMTEAAKSVRKSLEEASALMTATEAIGVEYQVQKWLGSLHSVGFSGTDGLASAFGQIAAGDVEGITKSGIGNLLVMAANDAGLSVADILNSGINAQDTNKLFRAMVEYLAKIYEETKDSRVVAQQYANVYGLNASDLKAAANLSNSVMAVSTSNLDYNSAVARLFNMSNTMMLRTSMNEMMTNLESNFMYNMAATLGSSPALMLTHRLATFLEDFGGGVDIPFINAMGFGLDLNTSVAQLMNLAVGGATILGGLGRLLGSLGSAGGFSGAGMLNTFGVRFGGPSVVERGSPLLAIAQGGATTSVSGYVGNSSSEDVQQKTLADASKEPNQQLAEAKAESEDIKLKDVDDHVLLIYEVLAAVADGTKTFKVEWGNLPTQWTL